MLSGICFKIIQEKVESVGGIYKKDWPWVDACKGDCWGHEG